MSHERRRFTRVSFDGSCRVRDGGTLFDASLLDISLRGALIEVADGCPFSRGRRVALEMTVSRSPEIVLRFEAELVHQQGRRVGVYFVTADIDSITHLRRLIELNSGDAEKTLQELFLWYD